MATPRLVARLSIIPLAYGCIIRDVCVCVWRHPSPWLAWGNDAYLASTSIGYVRAPVGRVIGGRGVGAHRCIGSRRGPSASLPRRVARHDLIG